MSQPWPVLYINLESDHERAAHMRAELARAGLEATRLPASSWDQESEAVRRQHYSAQDNARRYFRPLLPGERGCYLSHVRAWRSLLSSAAPALVVLEDDVSLQPDFVEVLQSLAKSPPDWDMVKLVVRGRERPAQRLRPLSGGHALIEYRRVPSLTSAYVVSREGARKLLASRVPFARPIDVDLRHFWENDLVVRGVWPNPVSLAPASEASRIAGRRSHRTLRHRLRKLLFNARYTLLNAWHRQHTGTPRLPVHPSTSFTKPQGHD